MKRRQFTLGAAALASAASLLSKGARSQAQAGWEVLANIAESCSCEIPCSCNFGLPTALQCHGSRLIEITGGHFRGRQIDGISFVVTFEMGKWTKLYVDESLDAERMELFGELLPEVFGRFDRIKLSLQTSPLTVERSAETVRFAVAESAVEMEILKGLEGEPIRISGLPSTMFYGYTQYRSSEHRHDSRDASFSYEGTSAFTSRMVASSDA